MAAQSFSSDMNNWSFDLEEESLQIRADTLKNRSIAREKVIEIFTAISGKPSLPNATGRYLPQAEQRIYNSVSEMSCRTTLENLQFEKLSSRPVANGSGLALLFGCSLISPEDSLLNCPALPLIVAHVNNRVKMPAWCQATLLPAEFLYDSCGAGIIVTAEPSQSSPPSISALMTQEAFDLSLQHCEQQSRVAERLLKSWRPPLIHELRPFSFIRELMIDAVINTFPPPFGVSTTPDRHFLPLHDFPDVSLSDFKVSKTGRDCHFALMGTRATRGTSALNYNTVRAALDMDISLSANGIPEVTVTDWEITYCNT